MALNPGDKCPKCREGLLVKTEVGLACDECSFEMDVEELAAAVAKAKTQTDDGFEFHTRSVRIWIETPEEAEEFLRGLILARQNNNSAYFVDLIDGVNAILEPWREHRLKQELAARG